MRQIQRSANKVLNKCHLIKIYLEIDGFLLEGKQSLKLASVE